MAPTAHLLIFLMVLVSENFGHEIQKRQFPANENNESLNPPHKKAIEKIVTNSIQELSFDLSYELRKTTRGNLVFSPLSIGGLLSLILLGTDGQTALELHKALYYSGIREDYIHRAYQSLIENLNPDVPGVKVEMTNQLFLKQGFPVKNEFIEMAKLHYKAGVQKVDFESNPTVVVRKVNNYVSQATRGKIKELIKKTFSPRAVLVAVNTIFFNGLWENPFKPIFTYNGTFFTETSTINIPMMVNENPAVRFLSGDSTGFDMIALPYKGSRFFMYILTPRGNTTVDNLEESLDSLILNLLIKRMTAQKIIYTIPRMQIKKSFNFKTDLKRLGIESIFSPTANFQRMTSNSGVFLEEVVHEALLEVTESGTVAAAATGGTTDRILTKSFIFDRSSLLFIRDDSNGAILFWAKVVEPTPLYT